MLGAPNILVLELWKLSKRQKEYNNGEGSKDIALRIEVMDNMMEREMLLHYKEWLNQTWHSHESVPNAIDTDSAHFWYRLWRTCDDNMRQVYLSEPIDIGQRHGKSLED